MPVYQFPFSVLDYGLTALALVVMGVIAYLFVRFLRQSTTKAQGGVVDALRIVAQELERHTEISRGMMQEFYNMASELGQARVAMRNFREEQRHKDAQWDAVQEAEIHQASKDRREILERITALERKGG